MLSLFVDGSESVKLTPERKKDMEIHTENEFTIEEAAVYWAGFSQIGRSDINAMFDYKTILNKLYDANDRGRLELCYLDRFVADIGAGIVRIGVNYTFDLSDVVYEFLNCKINGESLKKFASEIEKSPLPLFLCEEDEVVPIDETRINKIVEITEILNYDRLNIPGKGKSEIRQMCIDNYSGSPLRFTASTFKRAWRLASTAGKIRHSMKK